MQSRLFPLTSDPWLDGADLEQLLQHWDANPRDSETLARVWVQVGPTDTAREARDQLANHRKVWADRRAAVDAGLRAEYPEAPPVVVRGLPEARLNDQETQRKKRTPSGGKTGPKPKLLNPAILARLCDAIRTGATIELACKYAGINPSVYYDALNRAKAGDPEWQGVAAELADAEGACAVEMLATVTNAARNGTWPAAAWMLERRYPMMYGRSESRFIQQAEPVEPYQTREELIKALASIPADVLSDALAARKQSA